MNDKRRRQIKKIISQIDDVISEEQEYFDNMPENLQNGEKGEASQEAISYLSEALSGLENAIGN